MAEMCADPTIRAIEVTGQESQLLRRLVQLRMPAGIPIAIGSRYISDSCCQSRVSNEACIRGYLVMIIVVHNEEMQYRACV